MNGGTRPLHITYSPRNLDWKLGQRDGAPIVGQFGRQTPQQWTSRVNERWAVVLMVVCMLVTAFAAGFLLGATILPASEADEISTANKTSSFEDQNSNSSTGVELRLAALGKISEIYFDGKEIQLPIRPEGVSPYTPLSLYPQTIPKQIAVKIESSGFIAPLLLADLKSSSEVIMVSGQSMWSCTSDVKNSDWLTSQEEMTSQVPVAIGSNAGNLVDGVEESAEWISSSNGVGTMASYCKYSADAITHRTVEGAIEKLIKSLEESPLPESLFSTLEVQLDNDILSSGLRIPNHILQSITSTQKSKLQMTMLEAMNRIRVERLEPIRPDDPFPYPRFDHPVCVWPSYECDQNYPYRSIDGSCNNLNHALYGRAAIPYTRVVESDYDDGIGRLKESGEDFRLPMERVISTRLSHDQSHEHPLITQSAIGFGQFMDHDFNHTPMSKTYIDDDGNERPVDCGKDDCDTSNPSCSPILIPDSDESFNVSCLRFIRSIGVHDIGCTTRDRQQLNELSAFIDGSNVYGPNAKKAKSLRDSDATRGKLNMTIHPFFPGNKDLLPQRNTGCVVTGKYKCFSAGDERLHENHGLTLYHTIFAREHNRIEEKLHQLNPHWDGETLFQETRKIVGAILQVITYKELLPTILGRGGMKRFDLKLLDTGFYHGYSDDVDASMANHFATASFRFGHSSVGNKMEKLDDSWRSVQAVKVSEQNFLPEGLYDREGFDPYMRGLADQRADRCDRHLPDEMTNHLFLFNEANMTRIRSDLFSLNIRRGRDHGLPGYNAYRHHCGLERWKDSMNGTLFAQTSTGKIFRSLYESVDDVDLFAGGISERPLPGALVGETFACLLAEQFEKLRKGDRFWHENPGVFTADQLREIRKASLSKIYCDNSESIAKMQPNAMELPFREAFPKNNYDSYNGDDHGLSQSEFEMKWKENFNKRVSCSSLPWINLDRWKGGESSANPV